MIQFGAMIGLQGAVLLGIALGRRRSARAMIEWAVRPSSWFILFYLLGFIGPQTVLPFFDYSVLGLESLGVSTRAEYARNAQLVLTVFLLSVLFGYLVHMGISRGAWRRARVGGQLPSDARVGERFRQLGQASFNWTVLLATVGLLACLALAVQAVEVGARSVLVKSAPGAVLYAVSFWLTAGALGVSLTAFNRGKKALAVLTLAILLSPLVLLEGRGRLLWPLVQLSVFGVLVPQQHGGRVVNGSPKRAARLAIIAVAAFVLLQALDPLMFMLDGMPVKIAASRWIEALNPATLFLQRTFDGFHNFVVIVSRNQIPASPAVLMGGSGEAFMSTYFPGTLDRGVGYPATLPGELWIAGRWSALTLGAAVFGVGLAMLDNVWRRTTRVSGFLLLFTLVPWLLNPGLAFFDQTLKVTAAALPVVSIALFDSGVSRWRNKAVNAA